MLASLDHIILLKSLYIGGNSTSYGCSPIPYNPSKEEGEERKVKKDKRKKENFFLVIPLSLSLSLSLS